MAQTTAGPSPKIKLVVQPGADGKLGTADDIASLGPGDSGSAEYLVEGRREGTHVIEFNIAGTLQGLPVGPVQVTGRAAGSVLVLNMTPALALELLLLCEVTWALMLPSPASGSETYPN